MAVAQIKVKATLPSGEVKSLSFPQRATVEQVKNKFFDFVPPRFRKEPYFIQCGNAVLDLEFYKLLEAHHTVKEHLEAGSELEITFVTQLDAKKLKQKGLVETVTPTAKSVTKDFVEAQKHKDHAVTEHSDPVAEAAKADESAAKAEAEAAAKKKAEEDAAAKKKAEEDAAAKKKADEAAAAEKKKADDAAATAAAAKKKAEEEEAAKKKFIDEPPITKALEESNKAAAALAESSKGSGAALPASANEVQQRIDENRKKFKADEEADEAEHKKKLAEINAEWDAKLKELEEKDKAEEEANNAKVEELKKIGPTA